MKLKTIFHIKTLLASIIVFFFLMGSAGATQYPVGPDILDLWGFVKPFDGNAKELTGDININGVRAVAALAYEAGDTNQFVTNSQGALFSPIGSFGTWESVNFDSDQPRFEDKSYTTDEPAAVFGGVFSGNIKMYELSIDVTLGYLNNLVLTKGTIIAGFDDRIGIGGADWDYDDFIVAIAPAPVPEPATMLLFGCGLVGMAAVGRKKIVYRK